MVKNRRTAVEGSIAFNLVNSFLMLFLIVITAYPMLYVLFASFSDPVEFSRTYGLMFRPAGFALDAYKLVFQMKDILIGYRNTIFYTFAGTFISMALTISGAYVLSQKNFMLRKPVMIFILITMFFSGGMIPTFLVVQGLGMVNTVWAVLIPGCVSTYNLIVLRTSFESVPRSLLESAEIDGANQVTTMLRIVIPLSMPAIATITLFYAVGRWGEWWSALVYLQKRRDLYPLQMFIREMLIKNDMSDASYVSALSSSSVQSYLINEVVKYAVVVISTVPILLVYPFLQKYFVKGVMIGAIKE